MINEGVQSSFLSSMKVVLMALTQMTFHRMKNHQFYWTSMKILFHSVFGTKYTIQSVWDYTCHEFLIWLFFIMSFFEPFGLRTLAYSWTISGAWITFMMSSMLPGKEKMKNKRSSKWFGLCKSKMVLSNYMHSLAWTGYLQKIGCEPITISFRFHKLGIKEMLILHALCTNSVAIVTARRQKFD